MDAVMDFFKGLPSMLWDQVIHPPFKADPTVENTLLGLAVIALIVAGVWAWNRWH